MIENASEVRVPKFENDCFFDDAKGEGRARRVARVSRICFEASSGGASEGKYEDRLTMARRYSIDCVEGDGWLFWCAKSVSQSV